jgi:hypothetical protein
VADGVDVRQDAVEVRLVQPILDRPVIDLKRPQLNPTDSAELSPGHIRHAFSGAPHEYFSGKSPKNAHRPMVAPLPATKRGLQVKSV